MKVLTAAQMREVDRRTIEAGIPGLVLMENAASRVVDLLEEKFAPLRRQRIVVFCGKGNNGGDGLAVARQLHLRCHPGSLDVVLAARPEELAGDALANYRMLRACGLETHASIEPRMRRASIVVDALLGTGLTGTARGAAAEFIGEINSGFPDAKIVAVDVPSGIASDQSEVAGDVVRADYTVTFTAPKPCHVLWPACERAGEWRVGEIGSPPAFYEYDDSIFLHLSTPARFRHLFAARPAESNKGLYGHVLIVAGARGKTGAAAMSGIGALRAGAGLVTVASATSAIAVIASHAPELMTEPLPETTSGAIAAKALEAGRFSQLAERKTVLGLGPGMGTDPSTIQFIRHLVDEMEMPMVVDADALNAIAQSPTHPKGVRILTPHPGEMGRLTGWTVAEVQAARVTVARAFARDHGVHLVLKGNRSLVAFPNGAIWINPTGTPAMATGGTGDVLTGLLTGLIAQFPGDIASAVLASVWLHGRAGELGARELGEKSLIATDLFRFLPEAMREIEIPD